MERGSEKKRADAVEFIIDLQCIWTKIPVKNSISFHHQDLNIIISKQNSNLTNYFDLKPDHKLEADKL